MLARVALAVPSSLVYTCSTVTFRVLTDAEYEAFPFAEHDWVIDAFSLPAQCRHRDGTTTRLQPEEAKAIERLLRNPRRGFRPKELFPDAASDMSARKRFQDLRRKIEGAAKDHWCLRAIGRGKGLVYQFEPREGIAWAFIERAPPALESNPPLECPECGPYPRPNPFLWNDGAHYESVIAAQLRWRDLHTRHSR
jgi:hypothetical protein